MLIFFQKKSFEIKFKLKWEKEHPPDELIQMAKNKVAPKIPFAFLKSLINECDPISSDVGPTPCSWIFQIFKQEHEFKFKPLFELKFK